MGVPSPQVVGGLRRDIEDGPEVLDVEWATLFSKNHFVGLEQVDEM